LRSWLAMTFTRAILEFEAGPDRRPVPGFGPHHNHPDAGYQPFPQGRQAG
jgi:hypothetical protein